MNQHTGHRERLRTRFVKEGLSNFEPHEVLELLLYQIIPYKDTNVLAHRLIDRFGSLSNVIEAPVEQLQTVEGLSETSAVNLSLVFPLFCYYKSARARGQKLVTLQDIYAYAMYLLEDSVYEEIYVVCLDATGRVVGQRRFCDKSVGKVRICPRDVAETAGGFCSNNVVLIHSHPKGNKISSYKDDTFTKLTYTVLRGMEINLLEHIIVCGNDYYSFCAEGKIDRYYNEYAQEFDALGISQEELKINNG